MTVTLAEYGAAEQVAGSKLMITLENAKASRHILVDIGNEYLEQGKSQTELPKNAFPFDPKSIDTLFLTHAHADHIGAFLSLQKAGYDAKIYATPPTADISKIQWSQEINSPFIYNKMIKGKKDKTGRFIPFKEILYESSDLTNAMGKFIKLEGTSGVPYEKTVELGNKVKATFYEAGHIPGSAQILFEIPREDGNINVLTAFDLGRTDYDILGHYKANIPIVKAPHKKFDKKIDYIIIESTYGNKVHGKLEESIGTLTQAAKDAAKNKGILIIPAFSIMRTQMLQTFLFELYCQERLPKDMKFYLSSPMAEEVSKIIMKYHSIWDEATTAQFVDKTDNPFNFEALIKHEKWKQTEDLLNRGDSAKPYGVISASGMCTMGRIEPILEKTIDDPRNIILLPGFQAPGTRGYMIQQKQELITFYDKQVPLKAEVRKMGGLSGHADSVELIEHTKHVAPDAIVLIKHGEKEAEWALRDAYIKAGWAPERVIVMKKGQEYILEKGGIKLGQNKLSETHNDGNPFK
jgi:metallo-beta-lactamase family protein